MIPVKRQCIFCDNPTGFKGDEHVISRWILVKLNALKKVEPWHKTEVSATSEGHLTYMNTETRTANYDNIRSGFVCDGCNSELNQELEVPFQRIKPDLILFPFQRWSQVAVQLRAPHLLNSLSDPERQILARWAAKTTCVIESVTPGRKEERNWVAADPRLIRYETTLPRGWAVFAMLHEPTRPTFMSGSRTWLVTPSMPEQFKSQLAMSPRTVCQIGSLILLTVFLDIPGVTLRAQRGRHWPLVANVNIDWSDRVNLGHSIRQTPQEPVTSSVNTSLMLSDTLSIGYSS